MKRNHKWKAVWKGVEYSDSITGWAIRTSKSRTFLTSMINEATEKNIRVEDAMQYAIEQTPGERNCGGKKRTKVYRRENSREAYEESFANTHKDTINRFLYRSKRLSNTADLVIDAVARKRLA